MSVKPIFSNSNKDLEPLVKVANGTTPEVEPAPESYPIEDTIGTIPTEGDFNSFTSIQQIAVSATTTADDLNAQIEQGLDWLVVKDQNTGHLEGNAQMNMDFIAMYTSNGTHKMSAEAYESWQAYNNWILRVNDGKSGGYFDGSVLDWRGYKGWHIHERNQDFNAVIYP